MARHIPNPAPGAQDPADLFDQLGSIIASRYGNAEAIMIERIAKLARAGIEATPDITERARILRQLRLEGAAIAAQLNDPDLLRRVVAIASANGEQAALAALGIGEKIVSGSGITGTAATSVARLAIDLRSDLDQMQERITRWMPDAYQSVISQVAPNILTGVDTFQQAQRRAASEFLARGVRGFTDASGSEWRIGTYAEMATRTSVNRAWIDGNIATMADSADIHLVSIIVGSAACAKCHAHAGKIYSTDGTPAGTRYLESAISSDRVEVHIAGTLEQARATGWNHPNCRCTVVAYQPGLPIAKGSTWDPQAEKDRARLRELERNVRDHKRREAAAFDDVTAARQRAAVKRAQGRIRDHVRETGIQRRNYREQLGFSDGRALPASPPLRAVDRVP